MNKKNKNMNNKAASHFHFPLFPCSTLPYITKNLASNGRLDPSFTKEEQELFIREMQNGFHVMINDMKASKEDEYQELITIENTNKRISRFCNIALPSKFDYYIETDDNRIPYTQEDNNECSKNLKVAINNKKKKATK